MNTFILLWKGSLSYTLETWFLSVVPAIMMAVIVWLNVRKRQACINDMDGTIKTRDHLVKLQQAINYNMKSAIIFGILFIISMLVIIFYIKGQFQYGSYRPFITGNHFMMLGIFSLIAGQFSRVSDKKLKKLKVDSTDPVIASTYQRWLKEWKQIRVKLSDIEEDK